MSYSRKELAESSPTYTEVEKQLVPTDPELFDHYKSQLELASIEQMYLSHPDEEFSLRLREMVTKSGVEYTATLKDRGELTADGLARMEIETPISPELYAYYKSQGAYPTVRKLRGQPASGVTIDWCEGYDMPIVEVENMATTPEARDFYNLHRAQLIDNSGSPELSSEQLAHALHPNLLPKPSEQIEAQDILAQIMLLQSQRLSPIVASISGRSGSGKSTITNQILNLVEPHMRALRLSTDDYHQAKTWLESTYGAPWTNWDDPEVYNTRLLHDDLQKLADGKTIAARRFDFGLQEPVIEGVVSPCDLLIVEGIYAGSPDLADRHLHITIPTPLATCVGRRLARDQKEGRLNTSLGTPADILRYQLETAEPMYRQQTAQIDLGQTNVTM